MDYATDQEAFFDGAIKEGKIVELAADINPTLAQDVFDITG